MVNFQTMIMMMNEGLHHEGLLTADKYITGTEFIILMIMEVILLIGFDLIFFKDERRVRKFLETVNEKLSLIMGLEYVILIQALFLQHERYDIVLISHIIVAAAVLFVIIIERKEFDGVREFLHEKLGWLF